MAGVTSRHLYLSLVTVRLLWTCLPQPGYIHPDEFFQSVEVAAGDILGVEVVRTWEFNSSFPVRSIVPIYLSMSLPLLLLNALSDLYGSLITWYSVTVAVRLTVALLSLITDFAAMKLTQLLARDVGSAAVVMASSYLSLVYFTRTFSNTFEAFLFAALLLVVSRGSRRTARKDLSTHRDLRDAAIISVLIVIGVFNRPTFIAFAAVPYLWWLFSGGLYRIAINVLNSMLTAVPIVTLCIVCDSVYFSRLCIDDMIHFDELPKFASLLTHNLTLTPLNFILYNTQSGNLAEHGIHSRLTHFLVNLPLLFSVLSLMWFCDLVSCLVKLVKQKQPPISAQSTMLHLTVVVVVSSLSIFPHQEPRFLIPLLPVLAAKYAHKISVSRGWSVLWVVCNVAGSLFYGCIHQAGVMPCLAHLQLTSAPRHVIFWHTYTAPQHLLLLPQHTSQTKDHSRTTSLTSLEGQSVEDLINHLRLVKSSELEVMLAASSSEHDDVLCATAEAGIKLELHKSFWPHLSTEHLPRLNQLTCNASMYNTESDATDAAVDVCTNLSLIERIRLATSLNLYTVTFPQDTDK